jgi:hypothetical protein
MKDIEWVKRNFSKPYEVIWLELKGISVMDIDPQLKTSYSSIQKTRSFYPSTNDKTFLLSQISKNIEAACAKARHYNLAPKKASIFLKTKDFKYVNRPLVLFSATNAPEIIISLAIQEFQKMYLEGVLYRTTGVTLYNLVSNSTPQLDLFGGTEMANKFECIHKQIDLLESKLGKRVVHLASTHKALKEKNSGTDSHDMDRNLLFL